jgi:5-methylcytosine-specific restriction endonuclease McrA
LSKQLKFVGYQMRKHDMTATMSLIEASVGRFGLHKRYFKSEETFWNAVFFVVGMRREPSESFVEAVTRIQKIWLQTSRETKAQIINAIDREELYRAAKVDPSDYQVLGNTIILPRSEKDRKPRPPRIIRTKKITKSVRNHPSISAKEEFYKSWDWRTLRMQALKKFGRACQCCGAEPGMQDASGNPVRIVVDHIKPISRYWDLRLEMGNLQILCDECNMGKGNWDETDFRPDAVPDEWIIANDDIALDVLNASTGSAA